MSTLFRALMTFSIIFATSTLIGCKRDASSKRKVNLAIWGNYISPTQVTDFEKQTGIKLNISNYTSNEELLAKVQAGAASIDVAVPSDYMVSIMSKLGLLASLDKAQIPNFAELKPELLNLPFDPGNVFSVPYSWTTAGIAVNRALYKGEIKGWKDIFEQNELAGRISLLDDVREVAAAALKYHGYSVNTTNKSELKKAEETLLKVKPRVKMFRSDVTDSLRKKEVAVAQAYSSDTLQAAADSGDPIEYILPEEGGTRAIDTLVIFKNAPHPKEAHELVNYMIGRDYNVTFVKTMWGGPVVKGTRDLLPENVKTNAALFPSEAKLTKFESIVDVGEATQLFDELWTKIKTE